MYTRTQRRNSKQHVDTKDKLAPPNPPPLQYPEMKDAIKRKSSTEEMFCKLTASCTSLKLFRQVN